MHLFQKHTYIYSVWIKIIYVKFNAIPFDNIGFKYENYQPKCVILILVKIVSRKTRDSI